MTRWSVGQEVGKRFGSVLASWDQRHAYEHMRVLARTQLVVPMSARRPQRYRGSAAGVANWKTWLVSSIDTRQPMRDALARLRACRDHDFVTMHVIIDLFEEQMLQVLEEPDAPTDSPLTAQLARDAQRNTAVAALRWCQTARDEIAARAGDRS